MGHHLSKVRVDSQIADSALVLSQPPAADMCAT
jgi:hypothetical protein